MKIFFTGHRPKDLPLKYGYDLTNQSWRIVINQIKNILRVKDVDEVYTGMALGFDQAAAIAVLELKQEGSSITLHAVIPNPQQPTKWPKLSQQQYNYILSQCDKSTVISDSFSLYSLFKRNHWMVDNADMGIAFFDENRTTGGTFATIQYAKLQQKKMIIIKP